MWPVAFISVECFYFLHAWEPTIFCMESVYFFKKLPAEPDVEVRLVQCREGGELWTRKRGQGRKEHFSESVTESHANDLR